MAGELHREAQEAAGKNSDGLNTAWSEASKQYKTNYQGIMKGSHENILYESMVEEMFKKIMSSFKNQFDVDMDGSKAIEIAVKAVEEQYKENHQYLKDSLDATKQIVNDLKNQQRQNNMDLLVANEHKDKDAINEINARIAATNEALEKAEKIQRNNYVYDYTQSAQPRSIGGLFSSKKARAEEYDYQQKIQGLKDQLDTAKGKGDEKEVARISKQLANIQEQDKAKHELLKQMMDLLGNLSKEINKNLRDLASYRGKVLTRLDGAGVDFEGLMETVTKDFTTSTIMSTEKFMQTYVQYAQKGYAANLEQKSVIMALSDSVSQTFDAFNAYIVRLERIQNGAQTVARLGEETAINELLNSQFGDSTYMEQLYDQVSANLIEAESTMTQEASVAFDYVVQKWLGSLYSSGVSEGTIGTISSALGKLGSGNISGLNGTQEQVLLSAAANRSGQDYADMLINGLDASNTNKLLASMVSYLQEIAASTSENNVLASSLGNVFKLNVSDIKALGNADYSNLAELGETYQTLQENALGMIGSAGSRIGFSGQMQNLFDNFKYGMATTMAQQEWISQLYQTLFGVADSGLLDFAMMGLKVMGTGPDFNGVKVSDIMKSAMGGLGLISGIVGLGENIFSGNAGNRGIENILGKEAAWSGGEMITSGSGFDVDASGSTTSSKKTILNTSESDMSSGAMDTAISKEEQRQGVQRQTVEKTTDDIYSLMEKELLGAITDISTQLFVDHKEVYVRLVNSKDVATNVKQAIFDNQEARLDTLVQELQSKQDAIISTMTSGEIEVQTNYFGGV